MGSNRTFSWEKAGIPARLWSAADRSFSPLTALRTHRRGHMRETPSVSSGMSTLEQTPESSLSAAVLPNTPNSPPSPRPILSWGSTAFNSWLRKVNNFLCLWGKGPGKKKKTLPHPGLGSDGASLEGARSASKDWSPVRGTWKVPLPTCL